MARSATTVAPNTTSRSGQTSTPRIFHVLPQAVPADDWPRLLRDCAALGFDTVLIAPPFAPGRAGNVWLTSDHQRLHSLLLNAAGDDNPGAWLRQLADLCAQHGLALWLDWVVGRFDGEAPIVVEHPEWFRPLDQTDAPDPRVVRRQRAGCMAVTADAGELLSSWWAPQLDAWRAAGISGVCCHSPEALSATVWRALLQRVHNHSPDFRCLAWTPGLPAKQAAALGDAGFDLAACSLPWWDGRSAWLGAELANLRRHFPAVVAPLAARDESPLSTGEAEIERRRQLRKLTCATALADGWLLPMGLERGRPWSTMGPGPAPWDMRAEVTAANASFADAPTDPTSHWECLSEERENPGAWLERRRIDAQPSRLLLLNNDDQHLTRVDLRSLRAVAACGAAFAATRTAADQDASKADEIVLEAGEAQLLWAHERAPICTPSRTARPPAAMLSAPRIAIESPQPSVTNGRFAARRSVGETVEITADVFCDGHDMIAAAVAWRGADEAQWRRVRMSALGNDRFAARIALSRVGVHEFTIEAWIDRYRSYRQALEKKHAAGAVAGADIDEGRALVGAAIDRAEVDADDRADAELHKLRTVLRKPGKDVDAIEALLAPRTAALMQTHDARVFLTMHPATPLRIEAERRAARFASWYELFPRSQANDEARHGRFDDVIARLPDIADLGFDVLYMTPIHPIGQTKRKGRNNAASAKADDVGSPYAIGAADGGHDAVHRELGTLEDFQRLREAAAAHGMELALDFAIQCSPDHPWIGEHPEWFQWRSDGHIRHAENPPKVYEDIVNVDFYAAGPAQAALWKALRDVVLFWVQQGVRLFRVDNPHTKPFPFWEWMIGDVRARHPDVVFLAEAFTRPKPMYRLARLGFSQSYTYFTWRNAKQELQDYFTELCTGEPREYFCPHLFVNTPDINPFFLQHSGRSGFLIRAALACCLSGLWGMYSGFELCEAAPLAGREEYLDSEKYQLRARDWDAPGNVRAEIRQLNQLRRDHVELQTHLGLAFYTASDPNVLYFAKRAQGRESMLLIAINLDPHADHTSSIEVPLWEWKRPDDAAAGWHDLLDDRRGRWVGKVQQIFLPAARPYAIWRIQPENA